MELPCITAFLAVSPTLEHIDLKLVPEFMDTHVQHLMPNHAMKSQGLPFSAKTTANLAEGEGTDGKWEKGQREIVTLHRPKTTSAIFSLYIFGFSVP